MHRSHARLARRLSLLGQRQTQMLNAMTGISSGPPAAPVSLVPHSHQVLAQTGFDFPWGSSHGHALITYTGPAVPAIAAGIGALPYGGGAWGPLQAALPATAGIDAAPSAAAPEVAGDDDPTPQQSDLHQAAQHTVQSQQAQVAHLGLGNPLLAQVLGSVFPGAAAAGQALAGSSGTSSGPGATGSAPEAVSPLLAAALQAAGNPPQAAVAPQTGAAGAAAPQATGLFGYGPAMAMGLPAASIFPQIAVPGAFLNPAFAALLAHPATQQQLAQLGQRGTLEEVQAEAIEAPRELEAIKPFPRLAQADPSTRDGGSVTFRNRGVVVCPGE